MCEHLKFGADNFVEDATITTLSITPTPVTSIEWARNDESAEVVKIVNPEGLIVIEGTMDSPEYASYLAILDSNLLVAASVRLQLFTDKDDALHSYDSGYLTIGQMIPWGAFRWGIDEWGATDREPTGSVRSFWFDLQLVGKWRVTIDPALAYVEPSEVEIESAAVVTTTEVSDGIFRQDDSGVLCLEAESSESITVEGLDTWALVSDSTASGGAAMYKTGSEEYHQSADAGPRFTFPFTASQSGNNDVWARIRSDEGNSVYCVVDGNPKTMWFDMKAPYAWVKLRTCTLVAEQQHTITIAARDHWIYVDKIVIQPAGSATPTGIGPSESGTGTVTETTITEGGVTTVTSTSATAHVQFRKIMMGNTLVMDENFNYGSNISFLTDPDLHQMHDGRFNETRPQREARRLTLNLESMTPMDRYKLRNMIVALKGKPFLVSAYPSEEGFFADDYIFLARNANQQGFTHKSFDKHSTTLELVEA